MRSVRRTLSYKMLGGCKGAGENTVSTEENKAVVRRFVDQVWNQARLNLANELASSSYVVEGVGSGPGAVTANACAFRTAFPDLTITIEDLIAEGDKVVARMRLCGTHRGQFRNYAPTGRQATWWEVGIWTIRSGQLQEGWFLADMLGLRRQLGLLPDI